MRKAGGNSSSAPRACRGIPRADAVTGAVKVCEIFPSIQGESSHAGYPCVFVRLSGCNLRCSYCDTAYAYDEGEYMETGKVAETASSYGIRMIEVTGGEPLLQEEARTLMTMLCDRGHDVLLETNGSLDIAGTDERVCIILDMKTPSSGMSDMMRVQNLILMRRRDDVKFVLSDIDDYLWAKAVIREHSLLERTNVLLSPVYGVLDPALLAQWIVRDALPARLNLQVHKYIFGPDVRRA